jgi:hypothetical protein
MVDVYCAVYCGHHQKLIVCEVLRLSECFDHDGPRHPTHPRGCPEPDECPDRGAHAGGQGGKEDVCLDADVCFELSEYLCLYSLGGVV